MNSSTHQTPLDVARLREDFPILQQLIHGRFPLIYFDNAASTQRPSAVIDAMTHCYQHCYANVHRGIHYLSETASAEFESARQTIARFINANETAEVIFTSGTTASINLLARSLQESILTSKNEILLTIVDHHSNIIPWQQAAQRSGATVRFCPLNDQGVFDFELWKSLISDQTKIVAFPAISNVLGDHLPVVEMVEFARARGITTVVDAAQSVPHEAIDVQAWGADFVAFSGHKMLGPTGIGILYGSRPRLEQLPCFLGGGSMISEVTTEGFTPGELPAKFEAGTPPIVEAIGLGAAVRYLETIGMSGILKHEQQLALMARKELSEINGIQFLSAKEQPDTGIVAFAIEGVSAQDAAVLLDRKGIAVRAGHHCAMPLHDAKEIPASLRASFYLYNTTDEVAQFSETLKNVITRLR
ncbi:MAG: SufS family cysteine desulfurase [Pirellulaceae bacterium]